MCVRSVECLEYLRRTAERVRARPQGRIHAQRRRPTGTTCEHPRHDTSPDGIGGHRAAGLGRFSGCPSVRSGAYPHRRDDTDRAQPRVRQWHRDERPNRLAAGAERPGRGDRRAPRRIADRSLSVCSLAVGDFDDERSDIDLLAVTREPLDPEAAQAIAQMHDSIVLRFPR